MFIKLNAAQAVEEIHGMISAQNLSKIDTAAAGDKATFSAASTGVNKGNVQLELLNAAGEVVKSLHVKSELASSVELTAAATAGDAASTSTAIKWSVDATTFATGSVRITASGKVAKALTASASNDYCSNFPQAARQDAITGNGNYSITIPFAVLAQPDGVCAPTEA